MELPRAPWRLIDSGGVGKRAAFTKLFVESIHIEDNETVSGPVIGIIPFPGVMPLQVEFDVVPLNTSILWIVWCILTCQLETEALIEMNGPDHIA